MPQRFTIEKRTTMNSFNDHAEIDMFDESPSPQSDFQSRKRLKLWLIEQLDQNTCPGCEWINKETGYFKLIWKHYGRPGFNVNKDAKLFRDWAIHTRRYKPNEPAEVSIWKTRFRNALKKMNRDLEEVVSMHQLEGNSPYRVYRFRGKEEMIQIAQQEIQSGCQNLTKEDDFFKKPKGIQEEIEINKIKQQLLNNYNAKKIDVKIDTNEDMMDVLEILGIQGFSAGKPIIPNDPLISESTPIKSMTFNLYFSENQLSSQTLINEKGVRIAYRPPPVPSNIVEQEGAKEVIKEIFGPLDAHQIYFPYDGEITDRRKILSNMERGLVVECDENGDIYVTRLCIARVYYNTDVTLQPLNLERSKKTLVFSFKNQFLPQLEAFKQGSGKAPSYEVHFSFAEKWTPRLPFKGLLTRCVIQHNLSKKLMNGVRGALCDELCFSNKDSLDQMKEEIERIMINSQSVYNSPQNPVNTTFQSNVSAANMSVGSTINSMAPSCMAPPPLSIAPPLSCMTPPLSHMTPPSCMAPPPSYEQSVHQQFPKMNSTNFNGHSNNSMVFTNGIHSTQTCNALA